MLGSVAFVVSLEYIGMILYTEYLHSQNRVISLFRRPLMAGSHVYVLPEMCTSKADLI